MIETVTAADAEQLYGELKWLLERSPEEQTRGGTVKAVPCPTMIRMRDPRKRVVADVARDANPFFHVMETVWMFAGRNDVHWLTPFNKNMLTYAESSGVLNAAYGFRWRYHWNVDQLIHVADMLRHNPDTRQAVIAMWDPDNDLYGRRDQACNTHVYFRVQDDSLNMTVCNRSNDLVWGMCGANIVHLTYMHEFIARAAQLMLGDYYVFTNNLHIYKRHWDLLEHKAYDNYIGEPYPLTFKDPKQFLQECELFCAAPESTLKDAWLCQVAQPIYSAYRLHKQKQHVAALDECKKIQADDWRNACQQWLVRRFPFLGTAAQSSDTIPNESSSQTQLDITVPTSL